MQSSRRREGLEELLVSDRIPDWIHNVPHRTDEHHKGPLSILTVYHEVLYIQLCMLPSKSANCSCYIAGCLAKMWSQLLRDVFSRPSCSTWHHHEEASDTQAASVSRWTSWKKNFRSSGLTNGVIPCPRFTIHPCFLCAQPKPSTMFFTVSVMAS